MEHRLFQPIVQSVSSQLNTNNTFVVYGDKDELVAPSLLQQFANERGFDSTVMPDVGHLFHGKLTDLKNALAAHTKI